MTGCFGGGGDGESERVEEEMTRAEEEMERAAEEMERAAEEMEEGSVQDGIAALGRAMEEMGKAMNDGASVEPIDFRELRDEIPEELDDMEEVDRGGERGGNPVVKMSRAFAEFEGEDNERVKVEIVDLGNLKGAAMLGYGWLLTEVDEETRTRTRRSFSHDGYPAYLEFDRRSADEETGRGKVHVAVGERFIFTVEGRNTTLDRLREVVDDYDFDDLDDLKDVGVTQE